MANFIFTQQISINPMTEFVWWLAKEIITALGQLAVNQMNASIC